MTVRLPASLDDLRGLRAARWIRESRAGQVDNWGPDAQRRRQDEAIEQYELVDTGIAWTVSHSGYRKAALHEVSALSKTPWWAAMVAAAGRDYDVLLISYVSRLTRDAEVLLRTRREMHRAGGSILFAADRILSSDEDQWESFAREAVEAEAYSRRMGRRIREGYAERRRRLADPGGRPPFGFRRSGPDRIVEPDPALAGRVREIFELAADRHTDREIAARTGLSIHVVRGTLRSALYVGRLPDGSSTRFRAPIDPALWNRVQTVRATRRTRDGRPAKKRPYALSMLHCEACGRRLIGDGGRYRHVEACPEFMAAARQPVRPVQGQHRRIPGHSYRAEHYEAAIGAVLRRVAVGAGMIAELVAATRAPSIDEIALARVERERQAAMARYVRDRDTKRLTATMLRLDADERTARSSPAPALDAGEVVEYLSDLERTWTDAPVSRRALAEALFDRVEALGLRRITVTPSAAAIAVGLADAFRSGRGGYGRGGGSHDTANQLIVRLVPGIETRIRIEGRADWLAASRSA